MRFERETMAKVRQGKVTQLRRPVRQRKGFPGTQPYHAGHAYVLERIDDRHEEACSACAGSRGEYMARNDESSVFVPCSECSGHGTVVTYEVRSTTLEGEYALVTNVRKLPLNWTSEEDAKAEGYESRLALIADWSARHPRLLDYYVITFELTSDVPRFIARPDPDGRASSTFKGSRTSGHGDYATSAAQAIDDAEAVPAEYQKRLSAYARQGFAHMKRAEIEDRLNGCETDGERFAVLKAAAQGAGIDVRSELRVLEQRLLRKIEKQRRAA